MVFSSPLFLFAFLPAVLVGYFLTPDKLKNGFLLAASLAFYLVGAGGYVLLLLFSIISNYWLGRGIQALSGARRNAMLAAAIASNMVPLLAYKYASFAAKSANQVFIWLEQSVQLPVPEFFLPAGISFFTFQGLAYVIDVYRDEVPASRSLVQFALFKAFFPQLVAGPIVRYQDLADELPHRTHSLGAVVDGLTRFGFGLAKKVLVADTLGRTADSIFNSPQSEWSAGNAWLALVFYTLQIFFDFSGYSDMAIGMGRICGLRLPENFRQPYRATSVTEFWRRWHMTLSTWFRDYLYIPMGGNRAGSVRLTFNLLTVFVLCGLWHGANATFVLWGLYHGLLLVGERAVKHLFGFVPSSGGGWLYTILAVMLGWGIFRLPTLSQSKDFVYALAGTLPSDPLFGTVYYLHAEAIVMLTIGILIALWPTDHPRPKTRTSTFITAIKPWISAALFAVAAISQAPESFNPFIYFQF